MPLQILNVSPPAVLKDESLQQELNREGIVQIPFLSAEALAGLTNLYHTMHPQTPVGPIKGFYVSVHSPDLAYKLKIQDDINKIISPFCQLYFKDYTCVNTAMLVKSASPESELIFHQDWNAADETKFASYTLWIPLIDTTIENGTLFAAKRTHRLGPTYRSASLPSVYANIGSTIAKYLVPFEVKAGNAVLFDKAILHQSPPNFGKVVRPTVVSTVIHATAPYLTYAFAGESKNEIEAYRVANDYMQHYKSFFEDSVNLPADAVKTGEKITADFTLVKADEFEGLIQLLLHEN